MLFVVAIILHDEIKIILKGVFGVNRLYTAKIQV